MMNFDDIEYPILLLYDHNIFKSSWYNNISGKF